MVWQDGIQSLATKKKFGERGLGDGDNSKLSSPTQGPGAEGVSTPLSLVELSDSCVITPPCGGFFEICGWVGLGPWTPPLGYATAGLMGVIGKAEWVLGPPGGGGRVMGGWVLARGKMSPPLHV